MYGSKSRQVISQTLIEMSPAILLCFSCFRDSCNYDNNDPISLIKLKLLLLTIKYFVELSKSQEQPL